MDKFYRLKRGNDFIKSGYGVCWDFCEYERDFFKKIGLEHECYFLLSFLSRSQGGPTHTFLLYKKNENWFWFEYSFEKYRGIWKYSSKQEALEDIVDKFCNFFSKSFEAVETYKTTKAKKGLNTYDFVSQCLKGNKIELEINSKRWVNTFFYYFFYIFFKTLCFCNQYC